MPYSCAKTPAGKGGGGKIDHCPPTILRCWQIRLHSPAPTTIRHSVEPLWQKLQFLSNLPVGIPKSRVIWRGRDIGSGSPFFCVACLAPVTIAASSSPLKKDMRLLACKQCCFCWAKAPPVFRPKVVRQHIFGGHTNWVSFPALFVRDAFGEFPT